MKFIKLFESFGIKPVDVLEDIKSIAYILEDDGYDLLYEVLERGKMVKVKIYFNGDEIRLYGDDYYRSKLRSDGDRFLSLVREHLDYISKYDITKFENFTRELGQCYYQIRIFLPL